MAPVGKNDADWHLNKSFAYTILGVLFSYAVRALPAVIDMREVKTRLDTLINHRP